jgi:non-homologous end joining protein Ku
MFQQEVQRKLQEKPSNDTEEEWIRIKETLITTAQNIIGEKQYERNEDWYDQECQEIIETKWKARLKCIQRNARANQEDYNRERISAARVCHRKKRQRGIKEKS